VETVAAGAGSAERGPRRSRVGWARLLRRVFEVELVCPRCGEDLAVISFLTEPATIDRILAHVREEGTPQAWLCFDVTDRFDEDVAANSEAAT